METREKVIEQIKQTYYKEHGEMPSEERAIHAYEAIEYFAEKALDMYFEEKDKGNKTNLDITT